MDGMKGEIIMFKIGDRVKMIHKDNPFEGHEGTFVRYEMPRYSSERERLIVILDSVNSEHFFYKDEVVLSGNKDG